MDNSTLTMSHFRTLPKNLSPRRLQRITTELKNKKWGFRRGENMRPNFNVTLSNYTN
jgi:hypothetical protein